VTLSLGLPGKRLIQAFEQCRLESYKDGNGIWTIGWGHTGPFVVGGMTCTQRQADEWFDEDTHWAVLEVNRLMVPAPNQNQFDALVSLCFNIGSGALASSTLRKIWATGDVGDCADQFLVWDHIGGKPDAGLLRRRQSERALFLQPVTQIPQANLPPLVA